MDLVGLVDVVRNHHLNSSVSGEHCDLDKDLGQLLISQSRVHLDVIQIQVYGLWKPNGFYQAWSSVTDALTSI
jgi:hypothetical protein